MIVKVKFRFPTNTNTFCHSMFQLKKNGPVQTLSFCGWLNLLAISFVFFASCYSLHHWCVFNSTDKNQFFRNLIFQNEKASSLENINELSLKWYSFPFMACLWINTKTQEKFSVDQLIYPTSYLKIEDKRLWEQR